MVGMQDNLQIVDHAWVSRPLEELRTLLGDNLDPLPQWARSMDTLKTA